MMTSKFTRVALAGAAATMLSLGASSAMAQPNKCQKALEGLGIKYIAATAKNVQKCTDAIRKQIDGGDSLDSGNAGFSAKAVDACDKSIQKMLDARTKSVAKCLALTSCTAADLAVLGHLAGGVNAPGALLDFTCAYIHERAQNDGVNLIFSSNPAAQSQIGNVANDSGAGSDPGVQTQTFFKSNPVCATHACSVGGSANVNLYSQTINPVSPHLIPLTVEGVIGMDVCSNAGLSTDLVVLGGSQTKGLDPVVLGSPRVCTTTVNAIGYCDCGAGVTAPGYNYTLCRDSDTNDGDECTPATILSDDTGSTFNGPLYAAFSGSSVDNGCSGVLATAFKTVLPGEEGTDGTYCTPDDTAAVLPATGIPFSTGTSSATIYDANDTDGNTLSNSPAGGLLLSSCANLKASVLTGMQFSGSAIALEGGATGDSIIELNLTCN